MPYILKKEPAPVPNNFNHFWDLDVVSSKIAKPTYSYKLPIKIVCSPGKVSQIWKYLSVVSVRTVYYRLCWSLLQLNVQIHRMHWIFWQRRDVMMAWSARGCTSKDNIQQKIITKTNALLINLLNPCGIDWMPWWLDRQGVALQRTACNRRLSWRQECFPVLRMGELLLIKLLLNPEEMTFQYPLIVDDEVFGRRGWFACLTF